MRLPTNRGVTYPAVIVLGTALGFIVLVPLVFVVWSAFQSDAGLSLQPLRDVLGSEGLGGMVWSSGLFAVGTALLSVPLGTGLAYLYTRTNVPFRGLLFVGSLMPLAIPGVLYTISWIFLASPRIGIITNALEPLLGSGATNIYSLPGMVLVEGLHLTPLVFLLMVSAFHSMDPSLEESALVAGAGMGSVLRRVTLPMLTPALAASGLIIGVRALEAFEVPVLIGLPGGVSVFTSRIWRALQKVPSDLSEASAFALPLLVLTVLGIFLYSRLATRGRAFQTITGKARHPRRIDLGRWRRAMGGLVLVYFAIAIVAPVATLIHLSLHPFYAPPSLDGLSTATLDNYRYIFSGSQTLHALKNSVVLGVGAATIVMSVTAAAAWVVVRGKRRGRWLIDALASLPIVIPGLVLGVALLYVYLRVPLPIYGTLWILLIAYVTRYLPYGMRYATAAMHQISDELEESAQVAGGNWLQVFRQIHLPLLLPGLFVGWLYVTVISLRELSSSLLLYSPGNEVLSVVIWEQWENGQVSELAALGVLMVIMLAVLGFIATRVASTSGLFQGR